MTADGAIPVSSRSSHAASLESLMRRHQGRIFALASRLTGSVEDAQEIVQDAFLRLHRQQISPEDEAAVKAWLRTVTVNLCTDRARRKGRRPEDELTVVASTAPSPERQASEAQRESLLRDALQQLSERERTTL